MQGRQDARGGGPEDRVYRGQSSLVATRKPRFHSGSQCADQEQGAHRCGKEQREDYRETGRLSGGAVGPRPRRDWQLAPEEAAGHLAILLARARQSRQIRRRIAVSDDEVSETEASVLWAQEDASPW